MESEFIFWDNKCYKQFRNDILGLIDAEVSLLTQDNKCQDKNKNWSEAVITREFADHAR